jgi:phospholipase/carboxylesterase
MRNYAAVGVRGTSESPLGRGFFWPQHADSVESAQQRIMEAIDLAREKFNINPQRVFVAGYQCGGTMALRMALLNPSLFAGALSIGGRFPEGGSPLARYGQLRQLPLFIAHCRDSQSYTIDRVCDEVRLFHSAGLSVTLRQYPCGDELTTQMLHDADVWMMERVTGMPAAEPESCQPTGDFN